MSEIGFSGNCFPKENSWTESTSPWTVPTRSTVDRRPLPLSGARRSSASGRSGARELRPRGGPVNSMAGLPRLGRQWKSISPATDTLARKDDGEGTMRAKRGGALEVWEASPRVGSAFIGRRRGGGGPSAFNCWLEGGSMVGLKAPVFGIEEGGNGTD
jgi:hypothetical protein